MSGNRLFCAIGLIDDSFVAEAETKKRLAPNKAVWIRLAAAAACCIIAVAVIAPNRLGLKGAGSAAPEAAPAAEAPMEQESVAEEEKNYGADSVYDDGLSIAGETAQTFSFDEAEYRLLLLPDELEKRSLSDADFSALMGEYLGEAAIGKTAVKLYSAVGRNDVIIAEYPDGGLYFASAIE